MFDLENISQTIQNSHFWFLGLGTLCYGFLVAYFTGETRKLRNIPTTSPKAPVISLLGTWRYIFQCKQLVDDCFQKWPRTMFRIPELMQWTVVASERELVAELIRAPDSTFSAVQANEELVQMKYTLGAAIIGKPYHFSILRNQLRRSLPYLVPRVHEEVINAFEKHSPFTDDWSPVNILDILPKILCQVSNRIFVGYPLCRDTEFTELSTRFTFDVFTISFILRSVPAFLRPLVNALISNVPKQKQKALKFIGPIIDARREERENGQEQPVDMITWLMDAAKDEETTNEALTDRILAINFAAIHTSSLTFTHALYYIAASPEFAQLLREEIDAVVQEHGWTKAGLDHMERVDSFIRESQRMHPLMNVGLGRIALEDYTFSDGTQIPRGTAVAVNLHSQHFDEEVYENPRTFDPLRFVKMQEISSRRLDMTTTNPNFLPFGNGRHACPGRYFAASEIKLMLAYVVAHYDVKFTNQGIRPPDFWLMTTCLPNQSAEVLFRRRKH